MFWPFFVQTGLYTSTYLPVMIPNTAWQNPLQDSPLQKAPTQNEPPRIKNPLLMLTKKDLLNAGYQNKKKPWTEEEDLKLKQLRDQEKLDWPQISNSIQGRNPKMCYNRYRRLENHTKNLWKRQENQKILALVEEIGENWKEISRHFEKRTPKQIKEHYQNFLRPQIKKDDWTIEQDLKLIEMMNKFGRNWKYLEQNFGGRTQNQLKNRYFGRLKKLSEKKTGHNIKDNESEQMD